jgi:hypothetical protein
LPIPDPGSRIPEPKTATKERGEKISCHTFFCSRKFNRIVNYFIFEMLNKKIFKELLNFLPKKLSQSSQKYGFWIRDPRSGIRKTYFGSRIQGSKRHWIRIPDPGSGSATLVTEDRKVNTSVVLLLLQRSWDRLSCLDIKSYIGGWVGGRILGYKTCMYMGEGGGGGDRKLPRRS